jgi:hypothetical protein
LLPLLPLLPWVSGSRSRGCALSLLRVGGRNSSLRIAGLANGAGTIFSFKFCPRWRESPMMGIGGLRRSGGGAWGSPTLSGAGTGGTSFGISLILENPLSGVPARSEVGVMLRSWNLPGALGRPLTPPRERGGPLAPSSDLPNDS